VLNSGRGQPRDFVGSSVGQDLAPRAGVDRVVSSSLESARRISGATCLHRRTRDVFSDSSHSQQATRVQITRSYRCHFSLFGSIGGLRGSKFW
jgi:hypothetical protein